MKTFRDYFPFKTYILACRFGFLEETKEATGVGNTQSIARGCSDEEV